MPYVIIAYPLLGFDLFFIVCSRVCINLCKWDAALQRKNKSTAMKGKKDPSALNALRAKQGFICMIKLLRMFFVRFSSLFCPAQSRVSVDCMVHLCILLNSLSSCIDLWSPHESVVLAVNRTEVQLRQRKESLYVQYIMRLRRSE